jgi:hypothetical protein
VGQFCEFELNKIEPAWNQSLPLMEKLKRQLDNKALTEDLTLLNTLNQMLWGNVYLLNEANFETFLNIFQTGLSLL